MSLASLEQRPLFQSRAASFAACALAIAVVAAFSASSAGAEPTDALTVRVIRPDQQLERLIGLFDGTRAPNPAAALAAWRRKRGLADPKGMGKSLEAAIAALNPPMVRELKSLDGARAGFGFDPKDGHVRWYAVAPGDDGSFAALVSALILTDGGAEAPFQGVAVDRLGPPGSTVAARVPGVLVLAGSRDELPPALRSRGATGPPDHAAVESGLVFRLQPEALAVAGSTSRRRLVEAIRGGGLRSVEGTAALAGEAVTIAWTGTLSAAPDAPPLDPRWLDWVPAEGTLAAAAVALDASPAGWSRLFAWADRVEKADSAKAQAGPLRARLNVLGLAARVKPEADLWPHLRAVTAAVLTDDRGQDRRVLVALHVDDEAAAERLAAEFVPRVVASFARTSARGAHAGPVRRLGVASGRPVEVARQGTTVVLGWGESIVAASLAAAADPPRSAGPVIRARVGAAPMHRAGAVWPGRLGDPLLAGAPPVVWSGRNDGTATRDQVVADGLHGVVARLLERIPLDTEPAANAP